MKRSFRTWLPKMGATALSMALGVSVLPVLSGGNQVRAAEWSKSSDNTGLGTSMISNPEKPESKDDNWRGDYVLFGTYEGEPIWFRVLDNETEAYGGKTMLLDSDRVLYTALFDRYEDKDNDWMSYYYETMEEYMGPLVWEAGQQPQALDGNEMKSISVDLGLKLADDDDEERHIKIGGSDSPESQMYPDAGSSPEENPYPYYPWAESDIRDGLNGEEFLNKDGVFTSGEKKAIFTSVFAGGTEISISEENAILLDFIDGKTASVDDKIFILDLADVLNPDYGYSSYAGLLPLEEPDDFAYFEGDTVYNRSKADLEGYESLWWLRNTIEPCENKSEYFEGFYDPEKALIAANDGGIDFRLVFEEGVGVAPALNVDLTKVLFSTVISEASDDMGAMHKLTVIDDDLEIALKEGEEIAVDGSKITVPFSISENATQASVLIIDKEYEAGNINDANILYYGVLEGDGTGTIEVPSDLDMSKWGEDFFIYIIAEDINEMEETDYASEPVKIALPEKKDDNNDDNGDDNKTEYTITVTSTGNGTAKASVTKAAEGTEVTLTVTPDNGYKFKSYEVVSGGVTITDNKFTVGKSNVEIKVNFEASNTNNNNNNSNSNNSNTTTPTPAVAVNYTIIQGANAKWKKGTSTLPMIKIQRSVDDEHIINYLSKVYLGDKELKKDTDYTVKNGCIEITLTQSCVDSLSVGDYTFKVEFVDGSVSTTLTIQAADKTTTSKSSVKTGETLMYATYGIALLAAATAFVSVSYVVRKRKQVK